MEETEETEEYSLGSTIARYFAHGVAFSLLMFLGSFAWAFAAVLLISFGLLLGLIVGFIILLLIIGFINAFVTGLIWSFPVRFDLKGLLGHGIVLSIVLTIAASPAFLLVSFLPAIFFYAITLVVYPFVDGFLARNVAGMFEDLEYEEEPVETS